MPHRPHVTRRTLLKGLGISIGLPWLECVQGSSLLGAESTVSPRRMAFIFVPNGVHMRDWTPRKEGFGFQLPYILEPLADVQEELLVISGLTHDKGRANGDGPGDHARSASVFLTGAQPRKTSGANMRSGISVDQVAAQAIGSQTRFRSLELGCEGGRNAGSCDSGYSCAYSSNISWASESTPVGKETNPRLVFERLFASRKQRDVDESVARRQALRKSVLDFISEDAAQLQKRLSGNDNRKLDEYLTGVREIERRLERIETEMVTGQRIQYQRPNETPRDYGEHMRLLCDMMVLAFQTDSTRIATCMFANAGSNRSYRQIDVSDGHHSLSHHGGNSEKHAKIRKINRYHIEQLAYFLKKLKAVREGERTLLDNCMICYGSAISDGNRHNNEDLPILVAGRGGGTIDPGRHLRVESETPMCNLFLSMLEQMGAATPFIGDSTGKLRGLQA